MKLTVLNQTTKEYFLDMDPLNMLSFAAYGSCYAIGATIEDENGNDFPIGLAIVNERKDTYMILWMSIKADYRLQGYGDEFLYKLAKKAKEKQIDSMSVYFSVSFMKRTVSGYGEKYFYQRGFHTRQTLGGDFFGDVRSLLKQPCIRDKEISWEPTPFRRLTDDKKKQCLEAICDGADVNELMQVDENAYDKDLSFAVLDYRNEPVGGIVVVKRDDVLYPVAFLAENDDDITDLAITALNAAKEIYGEDTPVNIIPRTDKYREFLCELMPGKAGTNYILVGDTLDIMGEKDIPFDEYDIEGFVNPVMTEIDEQLLVGEDIIATMQDLGNIAVLKDMTIDPAVVEIGEVNLMTFARMLRDCEFSGYMGAYREFDNVLEHIDFEISCCVTKDDRIVAVFLVCNTDNPNTVRPVMLHAIGNENAGYLIPMIRKAYARALDKLGSDGRVIFRKHDERSEGLFRKLLGL